MKWKIKRLKGTHRNIYHFRLTTDQWFQYILFMLALSFTYDALSDFVQDKALTFVIIMAAAIAVLAAENIFDKSLKITPYGPKGPFIGLYSIEANRKINLHIDNGLIQRNLETACLLELVNKCFAETKYKCGVCLIGRSGSGKSTIINQFQYGGDFQGAIENFSDNYEYFEEYALSLYKDNPEKNLTKKTVFILDHFERYFSLNGKKKKDVQATIRRLSKLPVVFVFSMRQEFFVPFIEEFDINHLDGENPGVTGNEGILFYKEYLAGSRWRSEENILICGSENEGNDHGGGTVTKTMKRLCRQAFGDERGDAVYNHFCDAPLIQQQIIFNLMKHEYAEEGEVPVLDSHTDESMMMKKYYDVQLCSTGDYFMASRIMYLLCIGRNSGISFTDDHIRNALCIFEKKDVRAFNDCLEKLHDVNLIKYSARNSTTRYEVAHDYVAKSFEAYAGTELPANVKSALDEYKSEYVRNTGMNGAISEYRRKRKWKSTGIFGWIVFIFSIVLAGAAFGCDIQAGGGRLPWTVFVLCLASLLYVFNFYMNITRHYRKDIWFAVVFFYLVSMCFGTAAAIVPEYWLHFLGAGNASLGLSCLFIGLNPHLAESAKKWFCSYGWRTFVVGGLLILLALLVQFGSFVTVWIIDTKSVLQFTPMAALLIYAYLSHMSKEFFYVGVEGIFSTGR